MVLTTRRNVAFWLCMVCAVATNSKKILISVWTCLVAIPLIVPTSAQSATITYAYEALITSVAAIGNLANIPDVEVGVIANTTIVDGIFSYESGQSGVSIGSFNIFSGGPTSISINVAGLSFSYATPSSPDSARISVADGQPPSSVDVFGIQGAKTAVSPGDIVANLDLTLLDTTNAVFSQQSILPTDLLLSDFDTTGFRFDIRRFNFAGTAITGRVSLLGEITSLTLQPVPLPAALPLFAGGLGLLGLLGWRRKRMAAGVAPETRPWKYSHRGRAHASESL